MESTETKLSVLEQALTHSLDCVRAIAKEYAENGTDSLMNTDYGALLNTHLLTIDEIVCELDERGLFTMGWEPQ